MSSITLNTLGLCSNLLGTFVLAASLGFYISSLKLSINKLEMYIKSNHLTKQGLATHATGNIIEKKAEGYWSVYVSWFGVALMVVGFTLQLFVNIFIS